MRQHRGVFRRLAGVLVIVFAVDVAAISVLGNKAQVNFDTVGASISAAAPKAPAPKAPRESGDGLTAVLILVVGVAIGVGLIAWGSEASRKLQQELRDAENRNEPPTPPDNLSSQA
jgi:uncharacterized protein HemX